ncbi:hypothetical protein [Nitrosopumilus sp.]|uniref:hypothetical protein n=1 Tax=Nitrosopumilus sp. TaxID=2024843 RepID=UPI00292E3AAF|nr:hypothetical protein [Nitrosopumilus sp.]
MNLYFSNKSIYSEWEIYSDLHSRYFDYLTEGEEGYLISLADFLKESKIKSQTGVKLNEAIEHGIGEILEELL